jgi:geranylgeranyl diphosphate synthase, type II
VKTDKKMRNNPTTDQAHDVFDLKRYLDTRRGAIDHALKIYLCANGREKADIVTAMNYSIEAGGKRLRPILCIAAAHATGQREDMALPIGCALEMIHTYSLIHDDLPAMDDDDLRRGKPTCHKAFNEATAILAGDALLTRAFQLLTEHALQQPACRHAQWLKIFALIARAAGHEGMIEGQMRDIKAEGMPLTAEQLEQLHRLKTGALISASVEAGAIVGDADEKTFGRLREYGRCIGLAFQVTDDILNEEGDPEIMGKAVGTDRLHEKNTYPALMGLKAAKQKAIDLVNQALCSLDIFDNKSDPLRAIARYVIDRQR